MATTLQRRLLTPKYNNTSTEASVDPECGNDPTETFVDPVNGPAECGSSVIYDNIFQDIQALLYGRCQIPGFHRRFRRVVATFRLPHLFASIV